MVDELDEEEDSNDPCPLQQTDFDVVPDTHKGKDQPDAQPPALSSTEGQVNVPNQPQVERTVPVSPKSLRQRNWLSACLQIGRRDTTSLS